MWGRSGFFRSNVLRNVPIAVILVFIYSFQKGAMSWLLSRNIFVNLGEISFTFYMLHQVVISYTIVFFKSPISLFVPDFEHIFAQFLLLINIVFLSKVTLRYFEVPIRRYISLLVES